MSKIAGKVIYPVQFNRKVKGTCQMKYRERWTKEYAPKTSNKIIDRVAYFLLWLSIALAVGFVSYIVSGS